MNPETFSQFVTDLRVGYFANLARKTSWGREEMKIEFERALSDALFKTLGAVAEKPAKE